MSESVSLFSSWMDESDPDTVNPIDPELKGTVYCTALADGGQEEWDFLWARYEAGQDASEKSTIMYSLGCSQVRMTIKENN